MNDITTAVRRKSTALSTPPPAPESEPELAGSLVNFLARAVRDPSIDVAKLEALIRLQREVLADDARRRFAVAMNAAQAEMMPVLRDATNSSTGSKYARLETVDAALKPIYARHGFTLEFDSEPVDGGVRILCEVSHAAGHTKVRRLDAALDAAGPQGKTNKTPVQAVGSTVSYLRRYLTLMVFNGVVGNDDNDGQRISRREDGELVGRSDVAELYGLLADCSADPDDVAGNERRFLDRMKLDVRSLKDAPAGELPRLKTALLSKRRIMAERANKDS